MSTQAQPVYTSAGIKSSLTVRRLFVWLLLLALLAMGMRETLDPDMWWHLRTGEHILAHGIPRHDLFSFTVPDHVWVTHEWLSQVVMWLLYRLAGLPGLMVGAALAIVVTYGLVYAATPGQPYLAGFVTLLAALASAIVWGARPQIFNLALTALFVFLLAGVRRRRLGGGWLWWLPPLTLLWANLHSGYLLGVVLLATVAAGDAWQRWRRPTDVRVLPWPLIRRLAVVTGLGFLLAAVNPSGPALWRYPLETLTSPAMQAFIQEWHPPDLNLAIYWPFAALLGVGVLALIWNRERPTATALLLFGGTAAAALTSARHVPLFAIVVAPIVGEQLRQAAAGTPAAGLLSATGAGHEAAATGAIAWLNGALALLALLGVAGWTAVKVNGNQAAVAAHYPAAAVDYLEASGLAAGRGYHSYNWGGYLIWRGLPVYIDGRADVYGDDFIFFYRQAMDAGPAWRRPLQAYDVSYVLMEPGSPLLTVLAATGDWTVVYQDEIAHVAVPRPGGSRPGGG